MRLRKAYEQKEVYRRNFIGIRYIKQVFRRWIKKN